MPAAQKRQRRVSIVAIMLSVSLVLTACIIFYAYALFDRYQGFAGDMLAANGDVLELTYVRDHLEAMDASVRRMLSATDEERAEYERDYREEYLQAQQRLTAMKADAQGQAYDHLRDISNMFASYNEEYAVYQRQFALNREEIYLRSSYDELKQIARYIRDELSEATSHFLNISKGETELALKRITDSHRWLLLMVAGCVALCVGTLIGMTLIIARPIAALKRRMERYTQTQSDTGETYEHLQLSEIYDITQTYLYLIREIGNKHALEMELYRQQMHNIEIKSLLDRSELKMLQMQMNPHFLFNTLNSNHVLAQLGDFEQTSSMIERLSGILRYSMRSQKRFVSLREECAIIADYVAIQRVRFEDRIDYVQEVPGSLLSAQIPCMILQPLVENAILHGFEDLNAGGRITLRAQKEDGGLRIRVLDNGRGMPEELVERIMRPASDAPDGGGYGIGLDNVLRRMALLYGDGNVRIESAPGEGTSVELFFPNAGEDPVSHAP